MTETDNDKLELEKSKFLYEYQLKQYDYVKAQTVRLDDKSAKYLTFITLIMAMIGIMAKHYFFDIDNLKLISFTTLPIILIVLSFISISCILRWLFISIQITDVGKLSANTEMINFIKTNSQIHIYEGLSEDLSTIVHTYEKSISNKRDMLEKAFRETKTLGIILIILLFSIVIDMSNRDVKPTTTTTSTKATY